jgi:hypothetical protein
VGWGTNVKGGDHAPTSEGRPLRHWEVKTWYGTILLDCRYPQSRPIIHDLERDLPECSSTLMAHYWLLSASRHLLMCISGTSPHTFNIIIWLQKKINVGIYIWLTDLLLSHPWVICWIAIFQQVCASAQGLSHFHEALANFHTGPSSIVYFPLQRKIALLDLSIKIVLWEKFNCHEWYCSGTNSASTLVSYQWPLRFTRLKLDKTPCLLSMSQNRFGKSRNTHLKMLSVFCSWMAEIVPMMFQLQK